MLWLSCNKVPVGSAFCGEGFVISDSNREALLREQGTVFMPKYDSAGLLTAVVVDHASGRLLMVAHMNAEAIALTRETGLAHFHSRSRGRLWMKGETSGHVLRVAEIRVDCDQDALEVRVDAAGPACHTLAPSCFYRRLEPEGTLAALAG
ncbi:phosphoribosyl-AMP cyclohydrolase [Novosphingobium sp. Chol11]|uniref:phosphoribosyl-AMP cyclohydrolase n=1 Tax=Novosphingobium sp. Chol11 TaxID=1385763 RepID=UPI0025EE967A|nr:phosphoribosyl-AMP cyclohydrolase [Novosphingobium sp. Chol11]